MIKLFTDTKAPDMIENETVKKTNALRRITDKLFGGINMSWIKVILFAVITAVVTAVFLILPGFDNTSFREMGTTLEAWILFAVIIMVNCQKPLESALKVFVFFLISQPLIYLIQVPFSDMGWRLFGYYRYWFLWTLATFPMAFVGWYLRKRNWLSLLILLPAIGFLAYSGCGFLKQAIIGFPHHIISTIFCFAQVLVYLYAFFDDIKQRLVGLAAALIVIAVVMFSSSIVDVTMSTDLPGSPSLSDSAVISLEDSSYGEAEISDPQGGYVRIHMSKFGSTFMTIRDGDKTYRYKVEVISENGVLLIDLSPATEESAEQ